MIDGPVISTEKKVFPIRGRARAVYSQPNKVTEMESTADEMKNIINHKGLGICTDPSKYKYFILDEGELNYIDRNKKIGFSTMLKKDDLTLSKVISDIIGRHPKYSIKYSHPCSVIEHLFIKPKSGCDITITDALTILTNVKNIPEFDLMCRITNTKMDKDYIKKAQSLAVNFLDVVITKILPKGDDPDDYEFPFVFLIQWLFADFNSEDTK